MTKKVENELIAEALKGNAAAFSEIYLLLRGSVYGFVYRMLQETAVAEDITQETFMFLLKNLPRFDSEKGSLLSFLCGVARNKIIHHLRKHSTKFEFYEDDLSQFDEPDSFNKNPLEVLLNEELKEKIEEIIANLPPLQREVLILRELEELSYAEIADITDAEFGQVKVRLHRARKNLANELKPYLTNGKGKSYEVF